MLRELSDAVVHYDRLPHRRTTTARQEALAVGVREGDVAKTVILVAPTGFIRAVVPASKHVDLTKVRDLVGADVRLATEAELVGAYPMFELGAVPPFGGPDGDTLILDVAVAERDSVVIEPGSHRESIRLKVDDLRILAPARVADISTE